ncbi:MAG: orotidine-5-phosphate decarboxylase [Bacteroidota bacterium]|jgi:orotidine-5'-phosphate decarboxylase
MTRSELIAQIKAKQSFLCVGLDPDLNKLPKHLLECEDPIFEFNKAIIDATQHLAVAYKPNTAFYECYGVKGWESLQKTIEYIPKNCFIIADAKRGDIGNTSGYYAKTFFETLPCDAVTVAPYMGSDSVKPFLQYENSWVVLLALTSNEGAKDFQFLATEDGKLYERVLRQAASWGTPENLMFVVGATRSEEIAKVRALVPDHFFLVPGVGAQGGSLEEVVKFGATNDCGLLVNSSRAILYADSSQNFAKVAQEKALEMQLEMATLIQENNWF